MKRVARLALASSLLMGLATPVCGQSAVSPAPLAPMRLLAPAGSDPAVDAFYTARNNAPIWLKDDNGRAAARSFAASAREALLDGLPDPAALASEVEAAISANNDKAISMAWVRYVQALKAPVRGMNFGDTSLEPQTRPAAILAQAALAPSLQEFVRQTATVNPFYASLREAAVKQGATSDPHVRASLDRLRLVPASGRAILVDIANAELMMLQDGRVVDSMKVIVGKPSAATPLITSSLHYVTFNPYWHIPQDVAKRKVAPVVIKRGVSYLKAARYETVAAFGKDENPIDPLTVDWKAVADGSVDVHIRQLNGPNNMMGKMKFGFANDYGVYLHDTPHKELFAKAKRNLSLGCIRLERPAALAQWLLGREPEPPSGDVELHVPIDKGVPIFVSYLTARADGDKITYATDVYGWDAPGGGSAPTIAAGAAQ